MSNLYLRKITNSFQDVRLVSLSSWRQANEISPRDRSGPYVVTQEGYDPEDITMAPDEFVLGRSGRWMSMGFFYQMPVAERRAEFVFGTAAEVMRTMQDLPSGVKVFRPQTPGQSEAPAPGDDMAAAIAAGRGNASNPPS
jgi:hypothetical protein